MGKVKRFDIFLDNPSAVYFAGQLLSGRVVLMLSESMEMRGISLVLVGKGEVAWTESSTNSDNNSENTTYSASESYLNMTIGLFGNGERTSLPAGEHTFIFSCTLPQALPSSFEGPLGHVRYYCKSIINRPWKFDTVSKRLFTVNAVVDLNYETSAMNSASNHNEKYLCCFCCRSGPISASANINRIGYVPGEVILVNGEVSNFTRRHIDKTKAVLLAIVTYKAHSQNMRDVKVISEASQGAIPPGESDVWNAVPLRVPAVPPSGLTGCNIIDVHYEVNFIVDPSGPAFDLLVTLPIVVGTIPLRDFFNVYQTQPPRYKESLVYTPTAPPLLQYPDLPPPSYAESAFGKIDGREKDDNEYIFGNLTYTPSYMYYHVQ